MNPSADASFDQLSCLGALDGIQPFAEKIGEAGCSPLKSNVAIKTLQVNIGKTCNLMCRHCHVEAGSHRTESMTRDTMSCCLQVLADNDIQIIDVTGGAPELNPHLPWLISGARSLGRHVMVRTNLVVLEMPEYAHLPEFYAGQGVEINASLPYYSERDTDRQRGPGVFAASIRALSRLNELGYARAGGRLKLNLVYNPGGAFLPPAQQAVETDYRRVLLDRYGISFNSLFTLTNCPVGRFFTFLHDSGNLQRYMERLASAFNPATVPQVMCRDMLSVGWDGRLYDCDFNQMLGLQCRPAHIGEFSGVALRERKIALGNHCYACTAGAGSSCGGAVV
jgi:radical SAM/Cys-rich protein